MYGRIFSYKFLSIGNARTEVAICLPFLYSVLRKRRFFMAITSLTLFVQRNVITWANYWVLLQITSGNRVWQRGRCERFPLCNFGFTPISWLLSKSIWHNLCFSKNVKFWAFLNIKCNISFPFTSSLFHNNYGNSYNQRFTLVTQHFHLSLNNQFQFNFDCF